jgi:hypothetical protein
LLLWNCLKSKVLFEVRENLFHGIGRKYLKEDVDVRNQRISTFCGAAISMLKPLKPLITGFHSLFITRVVASDLELRKV